ncbi:ABC transporter ATP-binding protein [Eubacteriales bacterium OttesenSCG-928-G02]|nr:ABC transporter ATP-binding protein [Eubacteriales bacterium OttesenSCG-928-G02]
MEKMIEVSGLKKSYGKIKAVDGIDFYTEKGKLFAFLGPNGAGKSTTIDIICTFLKSDSGTVYINGNKVGADDIKIRNDIGCVFQDGMLDSLLTIEENLIIRGSFYGLKGKALKEAVAEVARLTGITELLNRQYGKLSGGQRRRCDVARALINSPKLLILDEPTTGLDPQTRKNIWEVIIKLQKEIGMTIFLTTHYMEEAAAADYVIIIDDGKIIAKGTPDELKSAYSMDKVILITEKANEMIRFLTDNSYTFKQNNKEFIVSIEATKAALPLLNSTAHFTESFEVIKGSMDDVFIAITGKEIRE